MIPIGNCEDMKDFVDQVEIEVLSGAGGDGVVSWRREKHVERGGPAGGDGGRGGSVYFEASTDRNTLLDFRFQKQFAAKSGAKGGSSRKTGLSAKDLMIKVPVGTLVKELSSGNILADLSQEKEKYLVVKGGRGGRGNCHFTSSTRQAPSFCEPGQPGESLKVQLELKLLAHIGIIGLPNAGKSSLISKLSACRPKIADYPFTTITPNLGIIKLSDGRSLTLADIPGLIEGASEGVGLGFQFLRHIERTAVLLHVIDCSSASPEEILLSYQSINSELASYSEQLAQKKQIPLLNKTDLLTPGQLDHLGRSIPSQLKESTMISCITNEGLERLKQMLETISPKELNIVNFQTQAKSTNDSIFEIEADLETRFFRVKSSLAGALIRVTDFRDMASTNHLYRKLKEIGLLAELEKHGITTGDTILLNDHEMIWSEFASEKLI